jgi:hypothetical protein
LLSENLKDTIREAYNAIVERKSLTPRWGQRQMIAEIANTLSRIPLAGEPDNDLPAVCVIEAGTGTGKTIAYAVAAIPMAQALGKRLVVATATIALQEQFVNKDLPDIRASSGMNFSFALAKGRRRYVCLSKLDRLMAEGQGASSLIPLYPDELAAPQAVEAVPIYDAMLVDAAPTSVSAVSIVPGMNCKALTSLSPITILCYQTSPLAVVQFCRRPRKASMCLMKATTFPTRRCRTSPVSAVCTPP